MIDVCEDLVFKGTEHAHWILCGYHRTREHVNWQFGLESFINWTWQNEEKVDQISFGEKQTRKVFPHDVFLDMRLN